MIAHGAVKFLSARVRELFAMNIDIILIVVVIVLLVWLFVSKW